jgi:hypothetical protein
LVKKIEGILGVKAFAPRKAKVSNIAFHGKYENPRNIVFVV